jgi:mersacidin/lichenicidin family type 2 lantibiotic
MSRVDVVRALRDPQYRRSLSKDQLAMLPQHPAGHVQISEQALAAAGGTGQETGVQTTAWFCTLYTYLARCC